MAVANHKTRTLIVGDSSSKRPVYENIGKDVYFYVSGSRLTSGNGKGSSKDIIDRRVAVFGGDVVISGSLRVEGGELAGSFDFDCDFLELTGSLDVQGAGQFTEGVATSEITTTFGDPFFVAGSGITLSSDASTGQITITSNSSVQNIEWNEKLMGTADGTNSVFMTAYTPTSSTTIMVFLNGVLQEVGDAADFTISGNSVTFSVPPPPDSKVVATYSK